MNPPNDEKESSPTSHGQRLEAKGTTMMKEGVCMDTHKDSLLSLEGSLRSTVEEEEAVGDLESLGDRLFEMVCNKHFIG